MKTDQVGFIEPGYRILFWPLLGTFASFGISLIVVGALLPRILADFHWSYAAAGVVLAANSVGYFVSTLLSGLLVQRIGLKRVIVIGLGIEAVSLFFFGSTPSVIANLTLNLFIGVGQGGVEVVVNTSATRMEREGDSHLMMFVHAAFSVGAIIGPVAIGIIVARSLPWQEVYRAVALLVIAIAVTLSLLPFGRIERTQPAATEASPRLRSLLGYPLLLLAFLALLLYVGLEVGVSNWVSEYFVTVFGTPASTGAFMVSVFWFGILIGRLSVSLIARGSRQAATLVGLALLTMVGLLLAVLMHGAVAGGIFFFLASLGCSGFYPLVMNLLGRHFKGSQSVAVGFAATGGGIGMFLFPLGMSGVAQALGIRTGFYVYVFMAAALTVCAYLIAREVGRRREESPEANP